METVTKKERNCAIDLFRYVCAVLVVSIHTAPFSEIHPQLSFFFTGILPRIAVPYFFCVSGYFYLQKLEAGEKPYLPYMKRLLMTYSIWSCLYYAVAFAEWGHSSMKRFLLSSVVQFFITGSSDHFWFFPALAFAVSLTTLFYRLNWKKAVVPVSLLCFSVGCISCTYYHFFAQIPLLKAFFTWKYYYVVRNFCFTAFPFFVCPLLIFKAAALLPKTKRFSAAALTAAVIVWLLEVQLVRTMGWTRNLGLSFCLYLLLLAVMLFLLRHPLRSLQAPAEKARILANFTYYSHAFILTCLTYGCYALFGQEPTGTVKFVLTLAISFFVGLACTRTRSKWVRLAVN